MHRSVALLFLVLSVVPLVRAQESCDKLLSAGVFDVTMDATDSSNQEKFRSWYCGKNFQSASDIKSMASGATFPIEGIPFTGKLDASDSDIMANYAAYCAEDKLDNSQAQTTQSFMQKADPKLASAFNQCLAQDGMHYQVTDMSMSGGDIIIGVKFISGGANLTVAHILKISPRALSCDSASLIGQEINGGMKYMRCSRTGRKSASLLISADWGDGLNASFDPIPKPFHAEAGTYNLRFCGQPGCPPPTNYSTFGWGPPPGHTANHDDCTAFDISSSLPAGGVLRVDEEFTIAPVTVFKGSFGALHPTQLKAVDSHTLLFCGTRDGAVEDYPNYVMDIVANFTYWIR